METYVAHVERSGSGANWSASIPELHVYATGDTQAETARAVGEAARWHVAGLREEGVPAPSPTAFLVEVAPSV